MVTLSTALWLGAVDSAVEGTDKGGIFVGGNVTGGHQTEGNRFGLIRVGWLDIVERLKP